MSPIEGVWAETWDCCERGNFGGMLSKLLILGVLRENPHGCEDFCFLNAF